MNYIEEIHLREIITSASSPEANIERPHIWRWLRGVNCCDTVNGKTGYGLQNSSPHHTITRNNNEISTQFYKLPNDAVSFWDYTASVTNKWAQSAGGLMLAGKKQSIRRKTCSSVRNLVYHKSQITLPRIKLGPPHSVAGD